VKEHKVTKEREMSDVANPRSFSSNLRSLLEDLSLPEALIHITYAIYIYEKYCLNIQNNYLEIHEKI
jgi:hypothetical protein